MAKKIVEKEAVQTSSKSNKLAGLKESFRKFLVTLKRKPHIIPGAVIVIAFLLFSLNLTDISNTTAKIQGAGMGLSAFCIMLFSILGFVCFLNAFPNRKKVNIPMLILMFAMFALIIYCDIHYMGRITYAINRPDNPVAISKNTEYIVNAYNILNTHMVTLGIGVVLVVLLPIYKKLLKKINTSIEVEDNGSMAEIELTDED